MRPVAESTIDRLRPLWRSLNGFESYLRETIKLSELYMLGVDRMRGIHDLAKAYAHLAEVLGADDAEARRNHLDEFSVLSELADAEVENGFRLLHAHLLVSVWGVFESAIDGVAVDWLAARPADLRLDPDTELKTPVRALIAADPRERAEALLESFKRRRGTPFARGINRFEDTLAVVGLDGQLPDGLADAIFELQQVRNAFAHCGGIADRQFIDSCPGLPLAIGEPIPVTLVVAADYHLFLTVYTVVIAKRMWAANGIFTAEDGSKYWKRSVSQQDILSNLDFAQPATTPLQALFEQRERQPRPT